MLDVAEPDICALIAAARDPGKWGEIAACAAIVEQLARTDARYQPLANALEALFVVMCGESPLLPREPTSHCIAAKLRDVPDIPITWRVRRTLRPIFLTQNVILSWAFLSDQSRTFFSLLQRVAAEVRHDLGRKPVKRPP
jgi:hypothetical protein